MLAKSCLILSLNVIKLLQTRRVQIICGRPYRKIINFSAFLKNVSFSDFCKQVL